MTSIFIPDLFTTLTLGVCVVDVRGYDTTNGSTGLSNKPSTHDSDVCHFTAATCHAILTIGNYFGFISSSSSRLSEKQAAYPSSRPTSRNLFSRSSARIRYGESPQTHIVRATRRADHLVVKPRSLLWTVPRLDGVATLGAVSGSPPTTVGFTR